MRKGCSVHFSPFLSSGFGVEIEMNETKTRIIDTPPQKEWTVEEFKAFMAEVFELADKHDIKPNDLARALDSIRFQILKELHE